VLAWLDLKPVQKQNIILFLNVIAKQRLHFYYQKMILRTSLFLCCLFQIGCSHFASNKRACDKADFMLPLPLSFAGNVFQISPCTSIEPLRIETGVEIDRYRSGVENAVQKGKRTKPLEQFAERMGCESPVHTRFLDVLIANKIEVFGLEFDKSDRQIVKAVRKFTLEDPELKAGCW